MTLTLEHALALDAADPLHGFRDRFHIPQLHGEDQASFCGNSGPTPVPNR